MMKVRIIGAGIAGCTVAWTLRQRGVTSAIFDYREGVSASAAAAFLMNPITGKRFVESWRFNTLFPLARAFYTGIESVSGLDFYRDCRILRMLNTPEEANEWSIRHGDPVEIAALPLADPIAKAATLFRESTRYAALLSGGRLEFGKFYALTRATWESEGLFHDFYLDYQRAMETAGDWDATVYCEGFSALQNPLFPDLPWQVSRGNALLLRFHDLALPADMIIKKAQLALVPSDNHQYWAGSTFNWDWEQAGQHLFDEILERVENAIAARFDIVGRFSAVRPTVKNRRPLVGQSRIDPRFYICNGLGTKGGVLAPFCADELASLIIDGKAPDPEIAV